MDFKKISLELHSLAVFRALLSDPVVEALCEYIDNRAEDGNEKNAVSLFSEFVSRLYFDGGSLYEHIASLVNNDENVFIKTVGVGKEADEFLRSSVRYELSVLSKVASLTPEELTVGISAKLPAFRSDKGELTDAYFKRAESIEKYGYGIYAKYRMFFLGEDGKITPVCHPDSVSLDSLVDYKREQQIILDNTKALLSGKPAANILLTGDAGTGKSSTVKAIVNELWQEGLRILEVRKEQLRCIPALLDELNANPLKFILFIDDLSFGKDDDNYSALKAILEGSVSAKSQNVVIYATSNRRHLVKESFTDREGDDIHFNDTLQEVLSLSDRFGIRITFCRPDKATYLDIVRSLSVRRGIDFEPERLYAEAERFALERGGRSPRAARQFVDSLASAK